MLITTAWALVAIGKTFTWSGPRFVGLILSALSLLGAIFAGWSRGTNHPLHDSMILALPAAFVSFYMMLARQEREGVRALVSEAHVLLILAASYFSPAPPKADPAATS